MALLSLAEKLATLEDAFPRGAGVFRASEIAVPRKVPPLSTGIGRLDALLSGGLPRGRLVEVVGGRSSGRLGVALSALAAATQAGENAAFIDLGGHFDPQETQAAGAELARILWVRPKRLKDAVLSAEVVLSAGFSLVVADLGVPPVGRRVPDASWVRLARSAEGHASALLLLTPYPVAGPASEAVVTVRRRRAAWSEAENSPRLLCGIDARFALEKKRGERPGRVEEARFRMEHAIEPRSLAVAARAPGGARQFLVASENSRNRTTLRDQRSLGGLEASGRRHPAQTDSSAPSEPPARRLEAPATPPASLGSQGPDPSSEGTEGSWYLGAGRATAAKSPCEERAGGAGRDPCCRSRRGVVAKSSECSERNNGSSPVTGPARAERSPEQKQGGEARSPSVPRCRAERVSLDSNKLLVR